MTDYSIPSGFIYKYQADTSLIDSVLSEVTNINFKNNHSPQAGNKISVNDDFYHEALYTWLDNCIKDVSKKISLDPKVELPITSCWVNKTTKLMNHGIHSHANSFLSGILYLTDNTAGETIFISENLWYKNFNWFHFSNGIPAHELRVLPTKGTLLLFPSFLQHKVDIFKKDEIRLTLAFNCFMTANFDPDGTSRTRLKIHSQSVKERLGL